MVKTMKKNLEATDPREVLRRLVEPGNSMIIIEHNLEVIAAADWVIDLGPEGGAAGGYLLAAGTPAAVAASPASVTGRVLREHSSSPRPLWERGRG